ncbi:MAG: hypothetical protein ACRER2_02610 [Methylococcales bacterium]
MAYIPPRFDYESIKAAIKKTGACKIAVPIPKDIQCLRSWVRAYLAGYGVRHHKNEGIAFIVPVAQPVSSDESRLEPIKAEPISLEEAAKYPIEQKRRTQQGLYDQIADIIRGNKIAAITPVEDRADLRSLYAGLYIGLKKTRQLNIHIMFQSRAKRVIVIPESMMEKVVNHSAAALFNLSTVSVDEVSKNISRRSKIMYQKLDLKPIQRAIVDLPEGNVLKVQFNPERVPLSTFSNGIYVWASRNSINLTMRKFADGVFYIGVADKSHTPPVVKLRNIEQGKALEELHEGKEVEVRMDRLSVWSGFGGFIGRNRRKGARGRAGVHPPARDRDKVGPDV